MGIENRTDSAIDRQKVCERNHIIFIGSVSGYPSMSYKTRNFTVCSLLGIDTHNVK